MKVPLPQLWQVCVGTLPSSIPFDERRIPRCTTDLLVHISDSFCFRVLYRFFFFKQQLSKSCHPATYTANFVRPGCNEFVHNPLQTRGYFAGR